MVIKQSMDAMDTKEQLISTTQKLSSGYKVNSAEDNNEKAASADIYNKMRYQIREAEKEYDNIQEGNSYCQTANLALGKIQRKLQKINELAVKVSDSEVSTTDRYYINEEIKQIKLEIQRICENTKFKDDYVFRDEGNDSVSEAAGDVTVKAPNSGGIAYNGKRYSWVSINPAMYDSQTGLFNAGTYVLEADDGTTLQLICQTGSEPPRVIRQYATSDNITFRGQTLSADSLGIDDLDIMSEDGVADTINKAEGAMNMVDDIRDKFAEYQSSLEQVYAVNQDNVASDMANEMVGYFNTNILNQATYSVLAQANQSNQGVLGLLA